jgi:hypothetical protein
LNCNTPQPIPGDDVIVAESLSVKPPENHFRDQLPGPGQQNPFRSPEPSQVRAPVELRASAIQRLRVPVILCLVMLALLLVITMAICGLITFFILEVADLSDPDELIIFVIYGIALGLMFLLFVVALVGLWQAYTIRSYFWAWVGIVLCTIFGLNFVPLLPFAIWGMVVLADSEVKRAFSGPPSLLNGND